MKNYQENITPTYAQNYFQKAYVMAKTILDVHLMQPTLRNLEEKYCVCDEGV